MKFKEIKTRPTALILFVIVFALLFFCGCTDNRDDSSDRNSGSGSLKFSIIYHGTASDKNAIAAVIDCAAEGVSTIEAHVYDQDNTLLISGGPWRCSVGQGTINAVPAGNNRSVVVIGKDAEDNVIFRGENPSVNVVAGQQNDAGTVDCYAFVPTPDLPADKTLTEVDTISFSWSAVAGASEYVIKVSENSHLTPPLIDETITATAYAPSNLSKGRTYYWQVFARDSHGNEGIGSNVRSVEVLGVLPIVPILTSILKDS